MGALVRNIPTATPLTDMAIPTRPDGSYYRYEMLCDGGWTRLYDDSVTALIAYLIPGYETQDEQQRLTSRVRHAVDMQVRMQAQLGVLFSASERTADEERILTAPRHIAPVVDQWTSDIPLVLVDIFYQPYTDTPRPSSGMFDVNSADNMWWLRPAEGDLEYLRSLHEASLIDLNVMKDEVS
jgi:hypothetical protein